MISAWWLLLIVPFTFIFGFIACSFFAINSFPAPIKDEEE